MKLAEVMDVSVLKEILSEDSPVEEIVAELFMEGGRLSTAVAQRTHSTWGQFVDQHRQGYSELIDLEGDSDIVEGNIVVLKGCPMAKTMAELNENGKAPAFHGEIIETYMDQNPGSCAILHPGCIAHQVARQLVVRDMEIAGEHVLNFYQLACRSGATGKVVYDENGLERVGMSREKADELIAGRACLYAVIKLR